MPSRSNRKKRPSKFEQACSLAAIFAAAEAERNPDKLEFARRRMIGHAFGVKLATRGMVTDAMRKEADAAFAVLERMLSAMECCEPLGEIKRIGAEFRAAKARIRNPDASRD